MLKVTDVLDKKNKKTGVQPAHRYFLNFPPYVSQHKVCIQRSFAFKCLTNILVFSTGVPPMGGEGGYKILAEEWPQYSFTALGTMDTAPIVGIVPPSH